MSRLGRLGGRPRGPSTPGEAIASVVDSLGGPSTPLVCGPFLGEPGFETLYWVPFLRNATRDALAGGREVVVISRGGTEQLYADLLAQGARYVDVLDVLSLERFLELERARLAADPKAKNQKRPGEVEQAILAAAGYPAAAALLPSHMFSLLRRHPNAEVCDWRTWPEAAPAGERQDLTVVKFWFGSQLPPTPENIAGIRRWIARFQADGPVAALVNPHSLETETAMDSPFDRLSEELGLQSISSESARTNLGDQIAAIGRARRFVATYGGLAYLSLYTNTPLVSFYANPQIVFSPHFSNFATAVASRNPKGGETALSVSLVDLQTT